MKRKITYGLLTIVLLCGLYYLLNSVFGLFTPYNLWTHKQGIQNVEIQIDSIASAKLADLPIEKVLELISRQTIVKDQIKLIDSLSKSQRHIILVPTLADTTNNIYLVKVCEDNGMNLVTYFNFLVDANSMKIINTDGKLEGQ